MLVRFERNGKIKHGWLVAEQNKIRVIEGDIYKKEAAKPIMTGLEIAVSEVELLSPCTPSKVICIGGNEREKTDELLVYTKTPSSVIGSNQP
ncbi:MAG: Rv2993c-like domain-containing protein, partial [Clostridia bacterium]